MNNAKRTQCIIVCLLAGILFFNATCIGKEERAKVLIIGLDALSWKVIDPLVEQEKLPNIASLIEKGVSGKIKTIRGCSPRYWTTIATGKKPQKHKVWGWTIYDREKGRRPTRSYDRKAKAIWNILSENRKIVGIVNYLASWPPEEVNGYIVPSFFYHSIPLDQVAMYPESLSSEIQVFNLPKFYTNSSGGDSPKDMIENAFAELIWVSEVARYIHNKKKPDLLILYTLGIDWLGHRFWKYMEPQYYQDKIWNLRPEEIEKYKNVIGDLYQATDLEIGKIIRDVDDNTTIVLLSDHGMKAWGSGKDTNLAHLDYNRILEQAGLLKFKSGSGEIDFSKTLAYCTDPASWEDNLSYLCINYEKDSSEFKEVQQKLIDLFSNAHFASTEQSLFKKVLKRDEIGENLPYSTDDFDLVVEEKEENPYRAPYSSMADEKIYIGEKTHLLRSFLKFTGPGKPGIHDLDDGVIILAGKNIRRGCKIANATIFDIIPTVLYLMGLPVARDMDGKVLVQAIDSSFLKENPIQFIESYEEEAIEKKPSKDEEILPSEVELKERLRSLGYIQ